MTGASPCHRNRDDGDGDRNDYPSAFPGSEQHQKHVHARLARAMVMRRYPTIPTRCPGFRFAHPGYACLNSANFKTSRRTSPGSP
jgi:hypothetical protein